MAPASSLTTARKRARENETDAQRKKREKAAERQRRKRERDRISNASMPMGMPAYSHPNDMQTDPPADTPAPPPSISAPPVTPQHQTSHGLSEADWSPEESARRDRVRASARERQRKHRQLVKAKRMRELGLDMGNDVMGPDGGPPAPAEVHYRVAQDGQYHQVLPHELQAQHAAQQEEMAHHGHPEPPFPVGAHTGGQTFASTLLLSFSCAPLLKAHIMRTLEMTQDELVSLEPIIADAWEQWNHARRLHWAQNPQRAPQANGEGAGEGNENTGAQYDSSPPANDFRARFQRPLVAPSPFNRAYNQADNQTPSSSTTASADVVDPQLSSAAAAAAVVAAAASAAQASVEARQKAGQGVDPGGEAENVARVLERA